MSESRTGIASQLALKQEVITYLTVMLDLICMDARHMGNFILHVNFLFSWTDTHECVYKYKV